MHLIARGHQPQLSATVLEFHLPPTAQRRRKSAERGISGLIMAGDIARILDLD